MGLISFERAAELARETVQILDQGGYRAASGGWVDLRPALERCVRNTVEYSPDVQVDDVLDRGAPQGVAVENESVLVVGRRLSAHGPVTILNFASGTHPGGGFLAGARAQEETIARSSGLYACLKDRKMYPFHRDLRDEMSSDYVIHSPEVPFFRTDEGELLDEPWHTSVLTCPAANAAALKHYAPHRLSEVPAVMRERTRKVLAAAVRHDARQLVLGAWGCGAFGIEPAVMAGIFHEWLTTTFARAFERVVFAITDWSEDRRFIGPFADAFL